MSILVYFSCIVHDLGAFKVAWKIQIISFLQVSKWLDHSRFLDLNAQINISENNE